MVNHIAHPLKALNSIWDSSLTEAPRLPLQENLATISNFGKESGIPVFPFNELIDDFDLLI